MLYYLLGFQYALIYHAYFRNKPFLSFFRELVQNKKVIKKDQQFNMYIYTSNLYRTPMLSFDFVDEKQHGVLVQITKKTASFSQKTMKSPKNDILQHISPPHNGMSESTDNKLKEEPCCVLLPCRHTKLLK